MQSKVTFVVVALTLALILNFQGSLYGDDQDFALFKREFRKDYQRPGEEEYRRLIFLKNKAQIDAHNSDPTQKYIQGVNSFTDMTLAELNAMYADLKISNQPKLI